MRLGVELQRMKARPLIAVAGLSAAVGLGASAPGCGIVLGIEEVSVEQTSGSTGTGTASGTGGGSTGTVSGTGGGTASGTGGEGAGTASGTGGGGTASGTGGGGTGGGGTGGSGCMPTTTMPCYTGPQGTEGVGPCTAGVKTCNAEGTDYGPCEGEVTPAVENCSTLPDESCALDCGEHVWSKHFGDVGAQDFERIAIDPKGNLLVLGSPAKKIKLGDTVFMNQGAYLAKFDAAGNHIWSKSFGPTEYAKTTGLAVDASSNIIITGYFAGNLDFGNGPLSNTGAEDTFLVKFDTDGNLHWEKHFGSAMKFQHAQSVAADSQGNILLTGYFEGSPNFGGGPLGNLGGKDAFVVKFSAAGDYIWSKRFGDTGDEIGWSIATDSQNNVLLAGEFDLTTNFGGPAVSSAGLSDFFVVKLNPDGDWVWNRTFGNVDDQSQIRVITTPGDRVVIVGAFTKTMNFGDGPKTSIGGLDAFTAVFDASSVLAWSRRFGGTGDDVSEGIGIDGSGNVLVTGRFRNSASFGGAGMLTSAGQSDVFVVKLDPTGAHQWSRGFGDASEQVGTTITGDALNNVYVAGQFQGTINFGGGPQQSPAGKSLFLTKLVP